MSEKDKNIEKLIRYYDDCEGDYRLLWSLSDSLVMHYGYWDETTSTFLEALHNTNAVVAKRAHITSSDNVLEAGCALGGTSLFLAQSMGCRAVGITIVPKQVESARKKATQLGLHDRVEFFERNYLDTKFPDASFDVVIGIESICQTDQKRELFDEVRRVLKPGGRFLIADFFRTEEHFTPQREAMFEAWSDGWGSMFFDTIEHMQSDLRSAGFKDIQIFDDTEHIMPSARRMYHIYWLTAPLGWIAERIGIRNEVHSKNRLTAYLQYRTLQLGMWKYHMILAHA